MSKRTQATYSDLVREAFIDSIRSALIVDDEYPSLDKLLRERKDSALEGQKADWDTPPPKMREIFTELRSMEKPCLVDVHDGDLPEPEWAEKEVKRLQQTDLLILDYELNRSSPNDGSRAIRIVREALLNAHFNLIIVHTHCDLQDVFTNTLLGLLSPVSLRNVAQGLVDDIKDGERGESGIDFDPLQHLDFRHKFPRDILMSDLSIVREKWPGSLMGELISSLEKKFKDDNLLERLYVAAVNYEETLGEEKFSANDMQVRDWRDWNGPGPCWIRCAKGFITFKQKNCNSPLLDTLLDALVSWRPHQSRLILTKLRAAMNENGVEVQDDALGETTVGASWYLGLLRSGKNTEFGVETMARNHGEQLFDRLLPNVVDFSKDLLVADSERNPIEVIKETYNVDLSKEKESLDAILHHNIFVDSKPVRGDHLELGHILRISGNYWLCLSPACDMVPFRESEDIKCNRPDHMDSLKRFTALRLHRTAIGAARYDLKEYKKVLDRANRLCTIFVNILDEDGSIGPAAFEVLKNSNASPVWMTMYACNNGCHDRKPIPEIDIRFNAPGDDNKDLDVQKGKAEICAQLRYEYALNVQSRLVQSMSRIGLDYIFSIRN